MTSASRYWTTSPIIQVQNTAGEILARIPLEFVANGHENTWRFVADVVDMMTNDEPDTPPLLRAHVSGRPLNLDDAPTACTVIYIAGGSPDTPVVPAAAMLSDRSDASGDGTTSTRSSNTRQRATAGIGPPGPTVCFVTGIEDDLCQAAHLVPRNRTEVYQRFLGVEYEVDDYCTVVMMAPHIHLAYDRHKLALYPLVDSCREDAEEEIWIVHYFCPPGASTPYGAAHRALHGTRVVVSRAGDTEFTRPNWQLARWHYAQTVRHRFSPSRNVLATTGTPTSSTPKRKRAPSGPTTPTSRKASPSAGKKASTPGGKKATTTPAAQSSSPATRSQTPTSSKSRKRRNRKKQNR